ncbi:MAG: PEGA domain-containing protein [Parvularculaceae bacterium]|nr:PEGA domain-containing protein [Parvularculaceae bacterium]
MLRMQFLAAALMFAGCETLDLGGGTTTMVLVTTTPAGALVTVENFGACEAPCTVEIDAPRTITVAKAGYTPQRLVLSPGKKKVEIVLELSAPTTAVDETELPEL